MNENWVFFKQWLKNPARLGTFLPIQNNFARLTIKNLIKKHNLNPEELNILELGSGTGRLTKILFEENFKSVTAVELDETLSFYLNKRFEKNAQFKGCFNIDAVDLEKHIPAKSIDVIISVIPFMYIPLEIREKIINAGFSVLKDDGIFWHVCYTPHAFLFKVKNIDISKQFTQWNHLPTGFVFDFKKKAS